MKRIVSLVLAVLMLAALFAGCSSGPEGVYKIKTFDGQDAKEFFESLAQLAKAFGGDEINVDELMDAMKLELKADGVAVTSKEDEAEEGKYVTIEGTWKLDGDKITITFEDESMEGTYKDGEIAVSEEEDGETHSVVYAK